MIEGDDIDLVRLFGLSDEEVSGLGLDAAGPSRDDHLPAIPSPLSWDAAPTAPDGSRRALAAVPSSPQPPRATVGQLSYPSTFVSPAPRHPPLTARDSEPSAGSSLTATPPVGDKNSDIRPSITRRLQGFIRRGASTESESDASPVEPRVADPVPVLPAPSPLSSSAARQESTGEGVSGADTSMRAFFDAPLMVPVPPVPVPPAPVILATPAPPPAGDAAPARPSGARDALPALEEDDEDDVDVASLFELSTEEVRGLGLDAPEGTYAPAAFSGRLVAGGQEAPPPVAPLPPAAWDEQARRADELDLFAMLDAAEPAPTSYAPSVPASISQRSAPPPLVGASQPSGTLSVEQTESRAPGGRRHANSASSRADAPLDDLDEDAGDVDVAALFGLSSEELRGLGIEESAEQPRGLDSAESIVRTGPGTTGSAGVLPAPAPTGEQRSVRLALPGLSRANEESTVPEAPVVAEAPAVRPLATPAPTPAATVPSEARIDPDLLAAFAEESTELLDGIHVELERLEGNPSDRDALLETRRCVHTLKGGAALCGFEAVALLTHSCENLFDLIAAGTAPLDAPALDAFFACEPLLRGAIQDAVAGIMARSDEALFELAARFDTLCAPWDALVSKPMSVSEQEQERERPDVPTASVEDVAQPSAPASARAQRTAAQSDAPHPDAPLPAVVAPGMATTTSASPAALPVPASDQAPVSTPAPVVVPRPPVTTADGLSPDSEAARPSATRRGATSINVDLAKVDTVVAKVTELATARASSQDMVGQLMETAEEAQRNATRLRDLSARLGNEWADMQPDDEADDKRAMEAYTDLGSIVLQLQEAVSDQQALVQRVYDTITMHWRLRATEGRANADIQGALMSIRLIPIAHMRVRLDGVIRQAAQATGKQVRWQLQGGQVAVEKNVFDRLFEPLMHLLRNSVDHGLESPEARRAIGKPEAGSIIVAASQEGNQIVITVGDDGAGIVPERIAALAVERGIVTPEQASSLTAQQKTNLIFTPGFSTAGAVSHLSGRGVGMDAVREACLRMGGSISVSSQPNAGTTVTMRLPLSLSVTRGLIVRDSGCLLALPIAQIDALHLVPVSDIARTPTGQVAHLEGQDLSIYNLPTLPGARPSSYVQNGEVNVLQVRHDGGSIGIVIEDVLDEEEILIKAPPLLLRAIPTLLGAYVLPNGTVAPVINLPRMLADLQPVSTLVPAVVGRDEREPTALVVDDSMSMRVALTGTLQNVGFHVLTARDGQEALEIMKREGVPALIMLDIEMPRMDGLETLFAVRQLPGARDIPVFMLSSRGGSKHRRAADQLGATRYFTKPYRDSELAGAARAVLASRW